MLPLGAPRGVAPRREACQSRAHEHPAEQTELPSGEDRTQARDPARAESEAADQPLWRWADQQEGAPAGLRGHERRAAAAEQKVASGMLTRFVLCHPDNAVSLEEACRAKAPYAKACGIEFAMVGERLVGTRSRAEVVSATFDATVAEPFDATMTAQYRIESSRAMEALEVADDLAWQLMMRTRGAIYDERTERIVQTCERSPSKLAAESSLRMADDMVSEWMERGEPDEGRDEVLRRLQRVNVIAFGGDRSRLTKRPALLAFFDAAQAMFAYLDSPERAKRFTGAPPHVLGSDLAPDLLRRTVRVPAGMTRHAYLAELEARMRDHPLAPGTHRIELSGRLHELVVRKERGEDVIVKVETE